MLLHTKVWSFVKHLDINKISQTKYIYIIHNIVNQLSSSVFLLVDY